MEDRVWRMDDVEFTHLSRTVSGVSYPPGTYEESFLFSVRNTFI